MNNMKETLFKIAICLLVMTPMKAFCQVAEITSQEDLVSHYMWQLAQRQSNVEQQLGFKPEVDFMVIDPSEGSKVATELEKANEILKKHEARAFGAWLSNPLLGEERNKVELSLDIDNVEVTAEIGGNKIKASNLGVILDVSGSMASYLDALRAEILESFPEAHFAEITGCALYGTGLMKDYYSVPGSTKNPFDPKQFPEQIAATNIENYSLINSDTLSAFVGLIEGREVDSIFWFCDLRDGMSREAIDVATDLIESLGVQVFVTSLAEDAPSKFRDAVESNEGSIIISDGKEYLQK